MRKRGWGVWTVLLCLTASVNLVAWNSKAFCDWHVEYLFPASVNLYGRLMGVFAFSVGEWMLVLGLFLIVAAVFVAAARIFWHGERMKKIFRVFYQAFAWIALAVFFIMTYNCFILYHASEFDEKYMPERAQKSYTDRELAMVRDHIVENLNTLSEQMERDETGFLVYGESITGTAVASMQKLGETYDQLAGYYPEAKQILSSDFLSQQYMMGYYFPFSMEANYNSSMYVVNTPATVCHELAHLKGIIYEDDANFIGFLACIESEDPFFRYSGYMSVLNYVEKEFNRSRSDALDKRTHPEVARSVKYDNIFLTDEAWEKVEKKAVVETAVVKAASNQMTESLLKVNGVEDGMKSYSRVVQLLLEYYDGILYFTGEDGTALPIPMLAAGEALISSSSD